MKNNFYSNQIFLITGGTGSFGNAVIKRLLKLNPREIRVFSRDEKKQDDMRRMYSSDIIKFYLGDVRDYESIVNAMRGAHYVFHAAALKQVPSCEFHPYEAFKTNVMGTENLLTAAINLSVKKVVCLSTDKAVYPVNAMGISKAMMEKVLIAKSRQGGNITCICGTRYGNVMGSRGSVIPLFAKLLKRDEILTITDPQMTRFMMSIDEAVDLVFFAFENGNSGDIFVQKSPAVSIKILSDAMCDLFNKKNHPSKIIGTRHGEKQYESLLTKEEFALAKDNGKYYRIIPDLRDLNYAAYIDIGEEELTNSEDYNSNNTEQLDKESMKLLLKKLPYIQSLIEDNQTKDH